MLKGFDEYLARGAEEALGEDTKEIACVGTCTCGAECVNALDSLVATYTDGKKYAVCVECKDTMISLEEHGVEGWICDPCEVKLYGEID